MRELLSLNEAAKRLRDLTIERNIAHLKSQLAQSEAQELHQRVRKLDSEVMYAAGDLNRAATQDIPEIYNISVTHKPGVGLTADDESAKQMIAKLVLLRDEKEINCSVGFKKDFEDVDEYMAKQFAKRYAENAAGIVPMDEETKVRAVLTIGCHCPEEKCEHQQPMLLTESAHPHTTYPPKDNEDMSPWDSTIE